MDFFGRMRRLAETELKTERLVLEPLDPAHAAALFPGLSAVELYRFIPQDPPADLAWLEARFTRIAARGPADGSAVWLNWAIRRRDGAYCGVFEATAMDGGRVDIAYFVFVTHQRQGLAREAGEALLSALWTDADTRVVGASLDTRNVASAALLESLDFVRIGVHKDADFFRGVSSDEYRYELARPDPASA